MKLLFINTENGREIKPTYITNALVVMYGELWEVAFGTEEDGKALRDGWAWKVEQPFKIEIEKL
jgi:hypothetical protein